MKALPQVGWFSDADQTIPEFDPPHDCPCPVCGEPVTPTDVRTVSLMPVGGSLSGFFRLHRTCAVSLNAGNATVLDHAALWIMESILAGLKEAQ